MRRRVTSLPWDIAVACPWAGTSPPRPRGRAPGFLVHAVKDERSGNLDRVQMIKGWVDAAGARHEKVYDIAWSGGRRLDAQGGCRRWATPST